MSACSPACPPRCRHDDQPPVRLRHGRRRHRRARHQVRRSRTDDRRRRRVDESRPFVMPKADAAFSRSNAVYDTTIGWRFVEQADEGPVRRRLDAGDGRQRRRRVQHLARRPGRLRPAQPAALGRCQCRQFFAGEIVPVTLPQKRAIPSSTPTSIHPRHHAGTRQAEGREAPTLRDRRQRLGRERRRLRADRRLGGCREAPWPHTALAFVGMGSPACRRASWASARRRRRRSCSPAPASAGANGRHRTQ